MKKTTKFISYLLALCFCLSITVSLAVPSGALADNEPPSTNPFCDVDENDWFYMSVMSAYSSGIIKGTSEDTFSPDMTMTRAMLVTVLYRSCRASFRTVDVPESANRFTDVKEGEWYTDAVKWASDLDIVRGRGNGCFDPDTPITRAELFTVLVRYADAVGFIIPDKSEYSYTLMWAIDYVGVPDFAVESVERLLKAEIIRADWEGNEVYISPDSPVTRAECAWILDSFNSEVERQTDLQSDNSLSLGF